LGETEIEDPSRFWDMHNGSKEDWMDTASQIPEVQSRLDGGETLQSLLELMFICFDLRNNIL